MSCKSPEESLQTILSSSYCPSEGTLGAAFSLTSALRWESARDGERSARRGAVCVLELGATRTLPIRTADVQSLVLALKERGLAAATVNRHLATLSVILREGEDAGWGTAPRIRRLKEPEGRERVLSLEEQTRLTAGLEPSFQRLVTFLVETGCRRGEALSVTWPSLTGDSASIRHTKGGKPRRVPLTAAAEEAIRDEQGAQLMRDAMCVGPWTWVSGSVFSKAFNRARDAAGLDKEVVPHALRHTCASRLLAAGVPLAAVKEWLGHSSITTTMRYAHLEVGALDAAREALERIKE